MSFERGRLIDNITHLVPGRDDLLGALDHGDYDATLLDLAPVRRLSRGAPRHEACPLPAITTRSAPIAAMSRSEASRHCLPRSTRP